jgi:hypothetical protein
MSKLLTVLLSFLVSVPAWSQNVNESAYERYLNKDLFNQMLPGYYMQGKKKVEAKIKFLAPIEMQNPDIPIIIDKGKGEEELSKGKLSAIFIDDKYFIPETLDDSVVWVLLEHEGAIRQTIYFEPVPKKEPRYYKVYHLVTNTITHEGQFVGSLAINFNKIMAAMTEEYADISAKIAGRKEGYRFIDYKKIIAEYNLWYQNEYPKRVKYINEVPDFQALIESESNKY